MVVPTRREAAALLLAADPPPWFIRHSSAVAEIAAFLAARIASRGYRLDRQLVEAAALLHDLDKLLPTDDPLRRLGHGQAGARWLSDHGYGELCRAVAAHPVTRLADGESYRRWAAFASREERIVAYADKRAGQHRDPLASRFAAWVDRSPGYRAELDAARPRAERLEADICRAAGLAPHEVRRLRWVGRAMRTAAAGTGPVGREWP